MILLPKRGSCNLEIYINLLKCESLWMRSIDLEFVWIIYWIIDQLFCPFFVVIVCNYLTLVMLNGHAKTLNFVQFAARRHTHNYHKIATYFRDDFKCNFRNFIIKWNKICFNLLNGIEEMMSCEDAAQSYIYMCLCGWWFD